MFEELVFIISCFVLIIALTMFTMLSNAFLYRKLVAENSESALFNLMISEASLFIALVVTVIGVIKFTTFAERFVLLVK